MVTETLLTADFKAICGMNRYQCIHCFLNHHGVGIVVHHNMNFKIYLYIVSEL